MGRIYVRQYINLKNNTEMKRVIVKLINSLCDGIIIVVKSIATFFSVMLGADDESWYGKLLRRIIATTFVIGFVWGVFALIMDSLDYDVCDIFSCDDEYCDMSEVVSDNLTYYEGSGDEYGYLVNGKGKKVLKGVKCINTPMDDDSLVCYYDGSHYGYFHMRDGKVVVQPKYDYAFAFSEGLAAVLLNETVRFIDTNGNVAFNKGFDYYESEGSNVFSDGFCIVKDSASGNMGVIDHNGEWFLQPIYSKIELSDTFWIVSLNGQQSVLSRSNQTIIPMTNASFEINDTMIFATSADHFVSGYSLQGKLLTTPFIRDVDQLIYDTREIVSSYEELAEDEVINEIYNFKKGVATCLRYESEGCWYGLMSPDGRLLTPPIYSSIKAVDKDLYLCYEGAGCGFMLNSKGQRVK